MGKDLLQLVRLLKLEGFCMEAPSEATGGKLLVTMTRRQHPKLAETIMIYTELVPEEEEEEEETIEEKVERASDNFVRCVSRGAWGKLRQKGESSLAQQRRAWQAHSFKI